MSRLLGSSTIYSYFRLSSKKRNDGGRPFYLYELDSALIQSVWKWDLRRHVDQSHVLALRTSREVDDQSICFIIYYMNSIRSLWNYVQSARHQAFCPWESCPRWESQMIWSGRWGNPRKMKPEDKKKKKLQYFFNFIANSCRDICGTKHEKCDRDPVSK